jgi:hypothetical protein
MYFLLLLVLAAATVADGSGRCTAADHDIIERIGDTFEARFSDFGGLFVTKSSYESKVQRAVGLSALCSTCFGEAYICGYDHCRWKCATSAMSKTCKDCVREHQCVQNCETCLE